MVHWQPGMTIKEVERDIIEKALQFFQGNKTQAAQSLGISVRTIDNKLKQYEQDDEQLEREKARDAEKSRKQIEAMRPKKDEDQITSLPSSTRIEASR